MKLKLHGLHKDYTGDFGVLTFVDGLSTTEVSAIEAKRMSILIACTTEDGQDPMSPEVNWDGVGVLESVPPSFTELITVAEQARRDALANPETPAVAAPATYTRATLEAIADQDGIAGLRVISDPLGLKATSIKKLIDEILSGKIVIDESFPNQDIDTKV